MDYKQSAVNGTSWQRCQLAVVQNPLNGVPSIIFEEEQAINVGGEVVQRSVGNCRLTFDPAATFPLLDAGTGQPTGAMMAHQDLYAALFSLYMQTAATRDGAARPSPSVGQTR